MKLQTFVLGILLGLVMIAGSIFGDIAQVYPQIIDVLGVLLWAGLVPLAVLAALLLPPDFALQR